MDSLSLTEARRMAICSQGLGYCKKIGFRESIIALGYIQIDTISKIQRSHHHVLWTRDSSYLPEDIDHLLAVDRSVFEYWGHAMSYLPMNDYRFALPKMRNFKKPSSRWVQNHLDRSKGMLKAVLKRVSDEGPLSTSDFESRKRKSDGWWDWKPAKFALEYLFWCGELMISKRVGFRKYYDLTERVLPETVSQKMPSRTELGLFLVKKALSALGIATEKEIGSFLQTSATRDAELQIADSTLIRKSIRDLEKVSELRSVRIESLDNSTYYILERSSREMKIDQSSEAFVHFLSPFDNLIIGRKRVENLFNFSYSLECYKPEAKREYGYFVLPILYRDRLVGRMDPSVDRKKGILTVRDLVFEPGFVSDDPFVPVIARKFVAFAAFNDCNGIEFNHSNKHPLRKELIEAVQVEVSRLMG